MTYPDKPRPAGLRLVPEVASSYPVASQHARPTRSPSGAASRSRRREGDSRELRLRHGSRSEPERKLAVERVDGDIVGVQAVLTGKVTRPSGVQVHGDRLVVHLTHAARDFPARTSTFPFCAVPASLPFSAEGFGAPFPGAGPYYIAEFASRQKLVLKRNPFYPGSTATPRQQVRLRLLRKRQRGRPRGRDGTADYVDNDIPSTFANIPATYRNRLHVLPGSGIRTIVLNFSQSLFRANIALRRAVSYAIDRTKLTELRGPLQGRPSDQYLTPTMPGYTQAEIYLAHPNVAKARQLARGATRSGKAVPLRPGPARPGRTGAGDSGEPEADRHQR